MVIVFAFVTGFWTGFVAHWMYDNPPAATEEKPLETARVFAPYYGYAAWGSTSVGLGGTVSCSSGGLSFAFGDGKARGGDSFVVTSEFPRTYQNMRVGGKPL